MTLKEFLESIKPEGKIILGKTLEFGKAGLIAAAKKSKTPIDDIAVAALVKTFEDDLKAKIEAL